jgi:hypothetical protein
VVAAAGRWERLVDSDTRCNGRKSNLNAITDLSYLVIIILKMRYGTDVYLPVTSVGQSVQSIWRIIRKDSHFHIPRREDLKAHPDTSFPP